VFTYFLVGEDCVQRLRRMSVEKPELFLAVNGGDRTVAAAALAPVASRGEDSESLCSSVVLLQDDANQLPTVRITDTTAATTAAVAGLTAAAVGSSASGVAMPTMSAGIGCTSATSVGVIPSKSGLVENQMNCIQLGCA
jgi:hypothetical protein